MSRFERFVLAVMWPVAVGLLGMAILETLGAWFVRPHSLDWAGVAGQNQTWEHQESMYAGEKLGREVLGLSSRYPMPQVIALILAVGTALMRSGLLRKEAGSEKAAEVEKLPLIVTDEVK